LIGGLGFGSTEFHVIRPSSEVLAEWVHYFVRQPSVLIEATKRFTGAVGQQRVPEDFLKSLTIPLPPLDEQRRITGALFQKMAIAEKARGALQAQLEASLALPGALVRETLREGPRHRYLLGECLCEVRNGAGADWSRYPVLGATRDGLAPAKEGVGKAPERYKLVNPVTVFYNPMRILLGSIAMVDEGNAAGITSPDYVVVKGRSGILDTRWFYYWFRSTHGAHLIDSLSRGAVRERILFNRLSAGKIELPDYETQVRASERMTQVGSLVASLKEELQAINALPYAIVRRAFAGGD
jgi:type I restriction enzyme S subunit